MASDDSILNTAPKFALITVVSLLAYLIAGYFCELEEVREITAAVRRRLPFLSRKTVKKPANDSTQIKRKVTKKTKKEK